MLTVGLLLGGCGSDQSSSSSSSSPSFAILPMNNGTTGLEPAILIDGVAKIIKDINPGAGSSNPSGFTTLNGKIYFQADDGTHGPELWVTDGTTAGTTMVKDIIPGVGGSYPQNLIALNGKLYFPFSS